MVRQQAEGNEPEEIKNIPIPFEFSGSLWIPAFARKTERQENSNGIGITFL